MPTLAANQAFANRVIWFSSIWSEAPQVTESRS
jgi:hypothetical protein